MKYQIAEFLIDTTRFRISNGGSPIAAEPKVFDLLVYLIAHRDRVVTREELFKEVWDGREVSDATLSNHVKSARKVLGDSGELQSTIQTIRGRGYQFIAPVTEIPNGGEGVEPPPPPQTESSRVIRPARTWRWALGAVGVLGVLVAALVGWRFSGSAQPVEVDAT
jgi:DNA-binding winged helix-turn-helix (wHTH) protein